MSANTPLLTDTSRLAAVVTAQDYAAGVASHVNGDWSQHIQLQVINSNWVDSAGNHIPGSQRLRILATLDGVDYALVIPIMPFVAPTTGSGPTIVTQPANATVAKGKPATFSVVANGSPVVTYAWRFKGTTIIGAVSSSLVMNSVATVNAGAYDCVVSNPFGFVITNTVQLFVT